MRSHEAHTASDHLQRWFLKKQWERLNNIANFTCLGFLQGQQAHKFPFHIHRRGTFATPWQQPEVKSVCLQSKVSLGTQKRWSTNPQILETTGKAHTGQKLTGVSTAKGRAVGKRKKTNRKYHTQRIQHKLSKSKREKKNLNPLLKPSGYSAAMLLCLICPAGFAPPVSHWEEPLTGRTDLVQQEPAAWQELQERPKQR